MRRGAARRVRTTTARGSPAAALQAFPSRACATRTFSSSARTASAYAARAANAANTSTPRGSVGGATRASAAART